MDSLAVPVGSFEYNGEKLGGRAAALAVDEELGQLYAAVAPTLSDDWDDNKLITINTESGLHIGEPITLGDTTRELAVNPVTHEIYASNGFSNTLSVVSPGSWSVTNTVDFSAAGVTSGTGTANADVWALTASASGDRLFVSHPYKTARVSIIDRVGNVDAVTTREPAPGQLDPTEPETPENPAWIGPDAPALSTAPAGSVLTADSSLSWSLSDYASEWAATSYGAVSRGSDKVFTFTGGTGWTNQETGQSELIWSDGFRLHPYPGLAPDVTLTFGNPSLSIAADGSGELVMDVAWSVSADGTSDGFARVPVATFAAGEVSADDSGTVTFNRSPEFEGRTYSNGSSPDAAVYPDSYPQEFLDFLDPGVRAWWYSSGSGLDPTKKPNPVGATFSATTEAAPSEPGTEEPGTEDPGTEEPGTEEPGTDEPGT
ncbi:MAG: HtaA domain-containing protein, partial [Mycetocola sp.]